MDRTSTRAWRRIQQKRVWRNRLRRIYQAWDFLQVKDPATGKYREAESWKELKGVKYCHVYKTTACPCSCPFCTGEQYNRLNFKLDTRKLISEQLESE